MMGRRQFLVTTGLLGASSSLGASAAGASTADGRRYRRIAQEGDDGSIGRYDLDVDGMGNAQTNTPPFCPRLKTHDGSQYIAYWTQDGELVVASRSLPDGDWTTGEPGIEIDTRDGHWTPALGVGPGGHVFLVYNTRDSEIRWRRSEGPGDVTSFGEEQVGLTGSNEESVTYVEFTRLQDGTLLEAHREGASGIGDWIVNRWDPDGEEWEPLHHPLIDGEGEFNSYMWNLVQSDDGTLHYFFNWRESWDVQTNVDLSYARSPDGGETWERSDGTPYELPITMDSAEVVDPIEPESNFINQGWASYDPETNDPHVTYYRDDEDGHTQIHHASLDGDEWVTEAATNRTNDVNLGGGGVVSSPIGRMGIVVDEDAVYILTRDFEAGSWPLLLEKRDGEWQTHVLYRRNLTWADVHIDQARWREDRVLSFIDQQQNVGGVSWTGNSVIGVTDVDPAALDRSNREVDLGSDEQGRVVSWLDATVESASTDATSFVDTDVSIPFTETSIPATPAHVRLTDLELAADGDAAAEARIGLDGENGETTSDVVSSADGETASTGWMPVPQAFRSGTATVQVRSTGDDATAELSSGTLEIGYYDPTATADERPSRELPGHVERVEADVLGGGGPLTVEDGEFADTDLTVDVPDDGERRLVARLVAAIDSSGARLKIANESGEAESFSREIGGGTVHSTGWTSIPDAAGGGAVTVQLADSTVSSAVLEVAELPSIVESDDDGDGNGDDNDGDDNDGDDDGGNGGSGDSPSDEDDSAADDGGDDTIPGFGALAATAGVGASIAALARLRSDEES